ncbi:MAG: NAD(P)/FAD-dependent oxidoreductase [Chloroflexi bacterium]|nr:NAD(P)/FAD-dependent oxidoreductase [Chloroflexota bacterium]MDK1044849.1 FAD/NAD(P)-binding oxidoreductase [Anaerolineales bacterium]MCH8341256.1 NAD(P)/FAD-dependent oxidoreductase [Chloroflexota bacterium]MCH8877241.1 NAD(P)/FAD-dependent oxidoreductase [Chloroflexota bacterium]MCI0772484.1 NAD(P)/FAD-dependent oxidoreductase [Chloroflexota bacterium]
MARVLVLGGGFGGVAAAFSLSKQLTKEDRITLVDRQDFFYFGFRKTWAFLRSSPIGEGMRPLKSLAAHGIEVRRGRIESIDPGSRSAVVDGERLDSDAMIVALGAQWKPETMPGLAEYGLNFYDGLSLDHTAYELAEFKGGRVAIVIPSQPYPCGPAPYEAALLLREYFAAKSVEAEIHVYSPKPMSLPVVGESGCSVLEGSLSEAAIVFHPMHTVERIEEHKVRFETTVEPYDLLIGIPGHVCPQVVIDSGLTDGGAWAKVDPRTLETDYEGVYAIGDVVSITLADGKPLPKAGVFAEAHAKVAADRIVARLRGETPTATYDGTGYCFLEVGDGKAMLVHGNFLAEPRPDVQLAEPAAKHLEAKMELERSRLLEWFPD